VTIVPPDFLRWLTDWSTIHVVYDAEDFFFGAAQRLNELKGFFGEAVIADRFVLGSFESEALDQPRLYGSLEIQSREETLSPVWRAGD